MADARATAHCFRALMCDERYIRPKIKSIMENLKRLSVSQTKATTETVLDLVDHGVTSSVKAELRLGEITRGKNKGAPRYECFVDDRCVGVSSAPSVDQIRKLYALEESDKLPNRVPCKALLQAAGSSAHCSVTITARGKLLDSVVSSAAIIRDECEMNYRKPAAPELNTNSQAPEYCSYPGAQQGTTASVPPAIPSLNGSASYGVGYDQSTRQSNIPVNIGEMPGCAKSAGRLVVVIIVLIFLIGMISRSCSSI